MNYANYWITLLNWITLCELLHNHQKSKWSSTRIRQHIRVNITWNVHYAFVRVNSTLILWRVNSTHHIPRYDCLIHPYMLFNIQHITWMNETIITWDWLVRHSYTNCIYIWRTDHWVTGSLSKMIITFKND